MRLNDGADWPSDGGIRGRLLVILGALSAFATRPGSMNYGYLREDGTPLWCVKCCNSAANFITEAPDGSLWATFAEGKIFRIPPHAPAGHKKKIP